MCSPTINWEVKTKRTSHRFYAEIVADITTRKDTQYDKRNNTTPTT
jgi:hypothetical protein